MQIREILFTAGKLTILEPGTNEKVRPLVHVGTSRDYFSHFPKLKGLINGTFFTGVGSPSLFILGDLKTDFELRGDVPSKPFHHQGTYFWQPAGSVNKPGYGQRSAFVVNKEGVPRISKGQPKPFIFYSKDDWLIGGGGALIVDGRAIANTSELTSKEGGGLVDQSVKARRCCVAAKNEAVHLVFASTMLPHQLAQGLQAHGYDNALMLDGGGATTCIGRTNGDLDVRADHDRQRYPVLQSVVGIVAEA